ncbi:MAG: O-antigen ligase family protein, partial [Litoreibacter sp.]
MIQAGIATFILFASLLRIPSVAASVLTACLLLHLPFVLSTFHNADFVLAALILSAIALLISVRYLDIGQIYVPRIFAAAILIWLAASLSSVIFSQSPESSYVAFRRVMPNILLVGLILWLIGDTRSLARIYDVLVWISVILAAIAIVQVLFALDHLNFGGLGSSDIRHISGEVNLVRPGGPVGDPNFFATYLIPGALISASRLFAARRLPWIGLYSLAALTVCGGIFATASRGGVIAFGLGILVLIAFERKIWPFLLIFATLSLFLVTQPTAYVDRITGGFSALTDVVSGRLNESEIPEQALAGRLGEMKSAVYMFVDNPWTGVGYGQFENHFQEYVARFNILMRNSDRGAHSLYLEVAAETGIIGLVGLLIVFALGFWNIAKAGQAAQKSREEGLFRDIRSFCVAVLFILVSHWLLHDAKFSYLWLFIGLLFIPVAVFEDQMARKNGK